MLIRTIALSLLLSGCDLLPGVGSRVPPRLEARLRDAERVEAVLVIDHNAGGAMAVPDSNHARIGASHLQARSSAVELSPHQRALLTTRLLDRGSYAADIEGCKHRTDLMYLFIAEKETTTVSVCHGCDHVVMNGADADENAYGTVTPIARQLEDLSHELFPADSTITALWQEGQQQR